MEPTDSPKRMIPICAVEAPSWSLMSGVRVTQEEIDRPGMRKRRNSAARRRRVARSIDEMFFSRERGGVILPAAEYVRTYTLVMRAGKEDH
ncbi:hypothetical protein PV648_07850 [Streptomyces sp. ID05-47C]|nr:hypothetical protein [Streptomyces sp. ID05-47C]